MKRTIHIFLSIIVGILFLFPLAWVFNTLEWPLFNGWALAHGSFVLAWPVLSVAFYCIISTMPWFSQKTRKPD